MELAQDIRLSFQEWDAFRRWHSPTRFDDPFRRCRRPSRFDAVVDRNELRFAPWFMPNARGAVVPSANMQFMKLISSHPKRPRGWYKIMRDVYRQGRGAFGYITVRFGALWSLIYLDGNAVALTFPCGSTPVMFRTYREAMWFCYIWQQEQIAGSLETASHGYSWTPLLPSCADEDEIRMLRTFMSGLRMVDRTFWTKYENRRASAQLRTA